MRYLSLFLILAMLMSFAACTKTPDSAETDPAETTAAVDPAETEDPALKDNLPDEKFDNEEIIIWLGHNLYNNQFNPDPDKEGDVMGEATNKRNAMVEDRFGVVLKWLSGGEGVRGIDRGRMLQSDVLAGDRIDIANGSYINDKVFAACKPTCKAPINPGPLVIAIASISSIVNLAFSNASFITYVIFSI